MPETELSSPLLQVAYGLVFLLLVAVTVGIGYLTFSDWRDRRRRSQSEKGSKSQQRSSKNRK